MYNLYFMLTTLFVLNNNLNYVFLESYGKINNKLTK